MAQDPTGTTKVEDKLIDVKGLGAVYTRLQNRVSGKLDNATNDSKVNQVLTADKWGGWEWKDLPAIPTTNDIRQIVNEQLAKTKFTINDQGHLIIETPEA